MIRQIENRARRALTHKSLDWIRAAVPSRYHDSPEIMAVMLGAAAEGDPALANSRTFEAAVGAVKSWAAGRDLSNRLARAYQDPVIRERASRPLEDYLADPSLAYSELVKFSVDYPKLFEAAPMQEALSALAEYRGFGVEHNVEMPQATPIERPIEPAQLDHQYGVLIRANARGELTPEEATRLDRLAAARVARDAEPETGSARAALPAAAERPSVGDYQTLIQKNAAGGLSAPENARLLHLAASRVELLESANDDQ
jgi:hypothetical protein